MRIAITGSHGEGKTTLVKSLLSQLISEHEVAIISKVARRIIECGYPLNMEADSESYILYILEQLSSEREYLNKELLISDRTILDPLAYSIVNRDRGCNIVSDEMIQLLQCVWFLEKQIYDFYVFVPIEFPMEEDGIRPVNEQYRKEIDAQILQLLYENGVQYIQVKGTENERMHQVLKKIDQIRNTTV